jgi:Terminase large subunit, T4likevirus-type, N-terminal/Terminase RNaseH-like domain
MAKNDDNYLSYNNLKRAGIQMEFSAEEIAEYIKCAKDPIYFTKKYVKIVHVDRGVVNFELWPFQERMIRDFHENRFSIAKVGRQSGKTTTVSAYILWCILFNDNFTVATLAHKHSASTETLDRIKFAYELLPKWLQQGVVEWNKTSIVLENGSSVISNATSAGAVRGKSLSLIYLDEFAHVAINIQNDFYTSVYPTISSGKSTKLLITSTPNGMELFYTLWVRAEQKKNMFKTIPVHYSEVPGRDERWREEQIKIMGERSFNQEFGTEFLGSSLTLISASKLASIPFIDPIRESEDGFRFFEKAERDHTYVIVVDTARGAGLDYSAFIVVDTTSTPFRIAATFRNNDISTIIFPKYILDSAIYFNNAYILIEVNDLGQQVVDILREDLEYDGIISTVARSKGHEATSGFGTQSRFGVRTTPLVKRLGCSTFKSMIESNQLVINDYLILNEMSHFTLQGNTYKADVGNDDLVMCGVLFAWLSTQPYFKDLTNTDLVKNIYNLGTEEMDPMLIPFGVIDTGHDDIPEFIDGDLWTDYSNMRTFDF